MRLHHLKSPAFLAALSAAAVFALGSYALQVGVGTYPRLLFKVEDDDRWDFKRRWSGEPLEPALVVNASSLGRAPSTSVAKELRKHVPAGALRVVDGARKGAFLGDEVGRVMADPDAQLHLVEVNFFTFNERVNLVGADDPRKVTQRWEWSFPLFTGATSPVRWRLLAQDRLESLLRSAMRERSLVYAWGMAKKNHQRRVVRRPVLSRGDDEDPPRPDGKPQRWLRANMAHKDWYEGTDADVLAAFVRWIGESPARARRVVVYFPPVNRAALREASADAPRFERDMDAWQASIGERLSALGVTVFDWRWALPAGPESFRDYGHLTKLGCARFGERMASGLGDRGLIPRRPSGSSDSVR